MFPLIFLFLAGLCLGSFANVLVDRGQKNRSLSGRSRCDFCHYQLKWFDNVPVFSWLILGGRCRRCGKKLSVQYPLVELTMGGLFALSGWQGGLVGWSWGGEEIFKTGFFLAFSFLFLVIALWDGKYMVIPDNLIWIGLVLAVLLAVGEGFISQNCFFSGWRCVFIQSGLGAFLVFGFFFLMFHFSSGRWIGGGDVRLGLLIGFLAGWENVYWLLLLAYLSGALAAVALLLAKRKKMSSQIPFGPFLLLASYVVLLWEDEVGRWAEILFGF